MKKLILSSIEYTYTTVIAELGQLGNNDNRYKLINQQPKQLTNKIQKGCDIMYKVIVAGSRNFNDYNLMSEKLNYYFQNRNDIVIVSGTCYGADKLGEKYAKEHNLGLLQFPADWNKYGKSAGYRRNLQMAEQADACVVFWDGESKGSKHMIDIAKKHNLALRVVLTK